MSSSHASGSAIGRRSFFVASLVAQVSALLRYVVLARLLGPEQLGLASTLVVTGAFFDMLSETGSDRFLIQHRDGDNPAVQDLVHLVMAGRGALTALALILASGPIAAFYKEPRLAHGFVFFALTPFILGLVHLDVRRVQRRLDYRIEALSLTLAEIASLVGTAVAAYFTRDFTAILYGLVARALVMVLVSHLCAERPFRVAYSREHMVQLTRFSGPLMANGLMLFFGSQGDRVLVVNLLGIKALGYYSAVLLLIYYPTALLIRFIHTMYLPMIAACRDDLEKRDQVCDRLAGQTLLLSVAIVAGFAIVAPLATVILYGHRFAQSAEIIALIGILQTCRFMVVWPTTVALSEGNSRTVLTINITRLLAYPCAFLGNRLIGGLTGIALGFIVGEAISLVVGIVLINRLRGGGMFRGFGRLATFAATCGLVAIGPQLLRQPSTIGLAGLGLGAAAVLAWTLWSERLILADDAAMLLRSVGMGAQGKAAKLGAPSSS
jgi:O-antigen/teichoic acid export membrane protein